MPSNVDLLLDGIVKKMKARRYKILFDAIKAGEIELSENIIESDDFLSSFFTTIEYVDRTRSDEKIKRFAKIFIQIAEKKITYNEFEDYTSIFNELTDREFAILCIKYNHEQRFLPEVGETEFKSNYNVLNPKQVTDLYWNDFKAEAILATNIDPNEFSPMLERLQRTGCYLVHKGYYDSGKEADGDTTSIFKKLYGLIKKKSID